MTTLRRLLVSGICILMLATGCGGGGGTTTTTTSAVAASGQNVVPISVNSGPAGSYANGLFASVTICAPGTSSCQTVPDLLVDTGSTGLRVLSSVLTLSLPQQTGAKGNPIVECFSFLSGFTWGPVQTADIQIGGERAKSVPIQVVGDTPFPVASGCKNTGLPSQDTLQALAANGILGIGLFEQDCGPACAGAESAHPGLYFECAASGCQATAESISHQVQNPIASFASDNNGVILELPALSSAQPSVNGSLIFGIGTQSNNNPGSATIYRVDQSGNFSTTFKGQSYPGSFVDSGSNGIFFLNSSITGIHACTKSSGFYCPATAQNLSATTQGSNGASGTINFTMANADSLFSSGVDFAFGNLGGPGNNFDWGLPFFFGRNVFTAIEGKKTPRGLGPYWAY